MSDGAFTQVGQGAAAITVDGTAHPRARIDHATYVLDQAVVAREGVDAKLTKLRDHVAGAEAAAVEADAAVAAAQAELDEANAEYDALPDDVKATDPAPEA